MRKTILCVHTFLKSLESYIFRSFIGVLNLFKGVNFTIFSFVLGCILPVESLEFFMESSSTGPFTTVTSVPSIVQVSFPSLT